jgi:hypothetical protein
MTAPACKGHGWTCQCRGHRALAATQAQVTVATGSASLTRSLPGPADSELPVAESNRNRSRRFAVSTRRVTLPEYLAARRAPSRCRERICRRSLLNFFILTELCGHND